MAKEPLVTTSELDELRDLQLRYERVEGFLLKSIREETPEILFQRQQSAFAEAVLARPRRPGRARRFLDDCRFPRGSESQRDALKNDARRLFGAAMPIANRVAVRIGKIAGYSVR